MVKEKEIRSAGTFIRTAILVILTIIFIFPILLVFMNSFKSSEWRINYMIYSSI